MSSIVYGHIHCFSGEKDAENHNLRVIEVLGSSGALIVCPMFSLLTNSRGHCYYGHLIHFSAYYKDFWCFDDDWISQYENFLENLYWDSSEVIHTYTGERHTWQSKGSQKNATVSGVKIQSKELFPSYHAQNAT